MVAWWAGLRIPSSGSWRAVDRLGGPDLVDAGLILALPAVLVQRLRLSSARCLQGWLALQA
jgi:hypothetical protein